MARLPGDWARSPYLTARGTPRLLATLALSYSGVAIKNGQACFQTQLWKRLLRAPGAFEG